MWIESDLLFLIVAVIGIRLSWIVNLDGSDQFAVLYLRSDMGHTLDKRICYILKTKCNRNKSCFLINDSLYISFQQRPIEAAVMFI